MKARLLNAARQLSCASKTDSDGTLANRFAAADKQPASGSARSRVPKAVAPRPQKNLPLPASHPALLSGSAPAENTGHASAAPSEVTQQSQATEIHGASATPIATEADLKNRKVKQFAAFIYHSNRYYRGTGEKQTKDSRQSGMDPVNKNGTSVDEAIKQGYFKDWDSDAVNEFKKTSDQHYYFTTQLQSDDHNLGAKEYAELASSPDNPPHITRAFLPKDAINTETDPDSTGDLRNNPAVRTKDKIPSGLVLRSYADPPQVSQASEAFKDIFNGDKAARTALKINTNISSEQAAQMLHEQQTPSPTDFMKTFPWK